MSQRTRLISKTVFNQSMPTLLGISCRSNAESVPEGHQLLRPRKRWVLILRSETLFLSFLRMSGLGCGPASYRIQPDAPSDPIANPQLIRTFSKAHSGDAFPVTQHEQMNDYP